MSKIKTEAMKVKTEAINARRKEYVLRLFVTGILPNSVRAVLNIKAICEKYLNNRYELEIIDIYQQPELALTEDILAVPVLVKKSPLPEVRMIGDLSNAEKVLNVLGVNY